MMIIVETIKAGEKTIQQRVFIDGFLNKHKIGDKIAAITQAIGIEPCERCKRRQAVLNGESTTPDN